MHEEALWAYPVWEKGRYWLQPTNEKPAYTISCGVDCSTAAFIVLSAAEHVAAVSPLVGLGQRGRSGVLMVLDFSVRKGRSVFLV